MKTITKQILPLLLLCCGFTGLQAQEWTEERFQEMYMEHLTEEGYRPFVDQDGDVQFKVEGMTYFIDVDADDPDYFAIMLANIWEIEEEAELVPALLACNAVTSTAKVAKGQIINNNVWLTCEVFIAEPDDFAAVFERTLNALQAAQNTFLESISGEGE